MAKPIPFTLPAVIGHEASLSVPDWKEHLVGFFQAARKPADKYQKNQGAEQQS